MNKNVLVCGWDGYLGYPLTLKLLANGYSVIGIDNFQRRVSVKEMGSFSAMDIQTPDDRIHLLRELGNFEHFTHRLEYDYERLCNFLERRPRPATVVNLAQQPSAPYSFKSRAHCESTTTGNLVGTINMLYWIKENAPDAHLIQIGSMGEYDPAAGTKIPEGLFDLQMNGKVGKNMIFPRRPGSFYHASKVASTYYIDAACRWWGLKATDIMQGVVYGNWTKEIEKYKTETRLDSDECFGTVVNRFIIQSLINEPLTIYGEGLQKRGYLALSDSIQCLMLAIENRPKDGEYRTWNQLDEVLNINQIAGAVTKTAKRFGVNATIEHIETPRAETTSDFFYAPETKKLTLLGFEQKRDVYHEIEYAYARLLRIADTELYPLKNVVKPKITWK